MTNVYVTNTGDEPLRDSWDGKPLVFAKGTAVEIPAGAARTIFGHGLDDKRQALARLGWALTEKDVSAGVERLAKFSITEAPKVAQPVAHHESLVYVSSRFGQPILGQWDGKEYTIAPKSVTPMPYEAAQALLGHERDDKERALELIKRFNPKINPKAALESLEIHKEAPQKGVAA